MNICRIANCKNHLRSKKKQLCNAHYLKWRRYGDPLYKRISLRTYPCSIKGCDSLTLSRGWCAKHYDRWLVYGDPKILKVQHELHGMHKHPLYNTWINMRRRCGTPKATGYALYGGRGIRVCDRWKHKLQNLCLGYGG